MIHISIHYDAAWDIPTLLHWAAVALLCGVAIGSSYLVFEGGKSLQPPRRCLRCPECGQVYSGYSAISRKDNQTAICPRCGEIEARAAWVRFGLKVQREWLEWQQSREGED